MSGWIKDLATKVDTSVDPSDLQTFGRDWTRVWEPRPSAIAFPEHADQVAEVLSFCNERGIAVVPSGGRTGLVGGAVARDGELVLSLQRLNQLAAVDKAGATLRAGAGAITESVHRHCETSGLSWPIDLGARGSSQIGGNLATNAGGIRVLRYGPTRHWVNGIEVALMDGRLLRFGRNLVKDNSGPNLAQLCIGSEGIFGVITAADLRLAALPRSRELALLGCQSLSLALELLSEARALPLLAFEFFDDACMRAVCRYRGFGRPTGEAPAYLLVESEGEDVLERWLAPWFETARLADGVVAQSMLDMRKLWAFREGITESLAGTGLMLKHDVSVPIARLDDFVSEFRQQLAPQYPGECFLFGHMGDGNLHLNIMKRPDLAPEVFWEQCARVDYQLYQLLRLYEGSISAEHGIGLSKKAGLAATRELAEIDCMRQLKRAFDPHGLLNPGKVFDL